MNRPSISENEEECDIESENILGFDDDIKRLKEGIELFKIYTKRNDYSKRTYKLDLVSHRLVASTKDWRCLKEGAKYCKKKSILISIYNSGTSNRFIELIELNVWKYIFMN
jgi:hypothetical protein